MLGLGVMIGAGIFNIAGRQAASMAGPGVILSFMIAGICSLLAAFCYAELTSTMPASGSAYTFTYVIFGELWAWVIGWALILEMVLAAAVVSRVWSLLTAQLLSDLNVRVPEPIAGMIGQVEGFDLLTMVILVVLAGIVALGARVGLRTLWIFVIAKLIAIGGVIVFGALHFDPANLAAIPAPEVPAPEGTQDTLTSTILGLVVGDTHTFGWYGIFAATPAIAFAYIGFDIVATAAEETNEPRRNVPQGMIRSLMFTTVIYIAVAVVMVGMVNYRDIDPEAPLATAFSSVGENFMVHVINIGGVLGLTTVVLVLLVGQTRIVFSMARDGLLPRGLSKLSRYRAPSRATLVLAGFALLLAETVPVLALEQLVVIGTMFAFLFVSAGVIAMGQTMPDLPRGFRAPLYPVVPVLSVAATLWLMLNLEVRTWLSFALWMAVGLLVYIVYGRRHSMLAPGAYNRRSGSGSDGGGRPRPPGPDSGPAGNTGAYGPYGPYSDQPSGPYQGQPAGPFPGQPGGLYPGQPGGPYPDQPGGPYPGQSGGPYPDQPGGPYPGPPGGPYPGQPGGSPGRYPGPPPPPRPDRPSGGRGRHRR